MGVVDDSRGAIKIGLTGYFDFKGVASRRNYWTWIAMILVFNSILPQFAIFLFIPTLAYGARRLNDVGKSPWWLLIFPVALYYSLKPTKSSMLKSSYTATSEVRVSKVVGDFQTFLKKMFYKLKTEERFKTKPSAAPGTSKPIIGLARSSKLRLPTTVSPEKTPTRDSEPAKKPIGVSDAEIFMKNATAFGLITASDESVTAIAQSFLRRIWSSVRTQKEPDPAHTDNLRLAIRALAEFGLGSRESGPDKKIEQAKALMWYGIILALISTEDHSPTTLGHVARLSASDALRSACKIFADENDKKMAARCMEELGQYGRLLNRSDLVAEGFNESVTLFEAAGATDRAKQATTNSGANFQRHTSAFFDGGLHSLKTTTILGSIQGEMLRSLLHHID